jgi:hypothetical protein
MADGDLQTSQQPGQQSGQQTGQNERFRGEGRGSRGPREGGNRDGGNREAGGFRIRLSDNEMRAARAVQEAFGLRSTVAALGLSIRTVAQLLEEGKLDELVAQQRASGAGRPPREPREGGRDGGRDGGRGERGGSRPNPFARPARPAAPVAAEPEPEVQPAVAEVEPAADEAGVLEADPTSTDVSSEA